MKSVSGLNGMSLYELLPSRLVRLVLVLSVTSVACGLGGCATTGTTAVNTKIICKPWRSITYDTTKDTQQTIYQIRVHNRTGERLKCW